MIMCVILCLLQWFDEQQQSYELLDGHLKKLHQAIETMIQCRKGNTIYITVQSIIMPRGLSFSLHCSSLHCICSRFSNIILAKFSRYTVYWISSSSCYFNVHYSCPLCRRVFVHECICEECCHSGQCRGEWHPLQSPLKTIRSGGESGRFSSGAGEQSWSYVKLVCTLPSYHYRLRKTCSYLERWSRITLHCLAPSKWVSYIISLAIAFTCRYE